MIDFNFAISNPFSNTSSHIFFVKHGKINKNKSWELESYRFPKILFSFNIDISFRQSHSGFGFSFGLFGYCIIFVLYDNRHWNYENNCWEEND